MVLLELDTLYEIEQTTYNNFAQNGANLWIWGGSSAENADVYISGTELGDPSALSEMELKSDATNVNGQKVFVPVPKYIAIVEKTATITEVVANGVLIVRTIGPIS